MNYNHGFTLLLLVVLLVVACYSFLYACLWFMNKAGTHPKTCIAIVWIIIAAIVFFIGASH